jgi:predicted permease
MMRAIETFIRDLKYAFRQLCKSPGFTLTAILTLALGIGANTAVFSLTDAILLRSLPVQEPQQLYVPTWKAAVWPDHLKLAGYFSYEFSYPMFQRFQTEHSLFSNVFGFSPIGMDQGNLSVGLSRETISANGTMVTGGYFRGLGITPLLGRPIVESDALNGSTPVAVISYEFWRRAFAGAPTVLGQTITLSGQPYTIVGVAPGSFHGLQAGRHDDIWIPIIANDSLTPWGDTALFNNSSPFRSQQAWWLTIVVRLRPGITSSQAAAAMGSQLWNEFRSSFGILRPDNIPSLEFVPGNHGLTYIEQSYTEPLRILMAVVVLLLSVTCASLATLLLARSVARHKEIAIRFSNGATRARITFQLLTETVLLSCCGGLLGLGLSYAVSHSVSALIPLGNSPIAVDVQMNNTVLIFTASVSIFTGIVFGLVPVWFTTHLDIITKLKESGGNSDEQFGRSRLAFGKFLVVLQVAISFVILIVSGYMLMSLKNLESQDIGLIRANRMLFSIDPTLNGYTDQQQRSLYEQLLERIQALPGVKSVSTAGIRLIANWVDSEPVDIESYNPTDYRRPTVYLNSVGPNFLKTLGIHLINGRDIEVTDTGTSQRVAIVNIALANKYFPGRNPIGGHITRQLEGNVKETFEIVGVCSNVKYTGLQDPISPTVYYPYTQQKSLHGITFYIAIANSNRADAITLGVRQVVHSIDPALLVSDMRSQADQIDDSIVPERILGRLAGLFGALALLLTAIGLYGTLSYAVNRRTKEIGIRMALGARRGQVIWLVVSDTAISGCVGVLIGIPCAIVCIKFFSKEFYGIQPIDISIVMGACSVLLFIAFLAGYLPARKAAAVNPIIALKSK